MVQELGFVLEQQGVDGRSMIRKEIHDTAYHSCRVSLRAPFLLLNPSRSSRGTSAAPAATTAASLSDFDKLRLTVLGFVALQQRLNQLRPVELELVRLAVVFAGDGDGQVLARLASCLERRAELIQACWRSRRF